MCFESLFYKVNSETFFFFFCTNLLAGDDGSGKTTLMAKIQGAEHGKKGRGLEYLYLNIHDEDRDGKFILYVIFFTIIADLLFYSSGFISVFWVTPKYLVPALLTMFYKLYHFLK